MRKTRVVAALVAFLVAIVWPNTGEARARFSLPEPEGPYETGVWFGAVQRGAKDDLTKDPADTRRLGLSIWYPAATRGSVRPWASRAMGQALAHNFPFPAGFERDILVHTTLEPRPAIGRFPTIIFSPGLSFPAALYQRLFESLSSNGFVVVAVGHPHGAALVEYPDGTSVSMDEWPTIEDEAQRQLFLARHAAVWEADLKAVLDWVETGGPDSPVSGHFDVDRLGVMGHSYGGTAAGRLSKDPRIDAVVLLEGAVRDPAAKDSRGQLTAGAPLLHVIGGYNRLEHEGDQYLPGPASPVYQVVINGTGHAQLSDLIFLYSHFADSEWRRRHRYETEPARVLQIVSDYALAFFDRYLRATSKDSVLLKPKSYADKVDSPGRGGYPEVDLSITVR